MEKGKMRVIKKYLVLATIVLALVFSVSAQQTFAEENDYVYPTIETNCDQINATAYRFHPGDTLNFTFTFTTSGPVYAYYYRNITHYHKLEPRDAEGDFYIFDRTDGGKWGYTYYGLGFEGHGGSRGYIRIGFQEAGEHTVEFVHRFITYGDADGFYVMNFLLEPRLTLEKKNSPIPTIPLLISGVSGAAIAFAVSAVVWHKRGLAKKEKVNVNP